MFQMFSYVQLDFVYAGVMQRRIATIPRKATKKSPPFVFEL